MRRTILVTSGAGFIGLHLADALLAKGIAREHVDQAAVELAGRGLAV